MSLEPKKISISDMKYAENQHASSVQQQNTPEQKNKAGKLSEFLQNFRSSQQAAQGSSDASELSFQQVRDSLASQQAQETTLREQMSQIGGKKPTLTEAFQQAAAAQGSQSAQQTQQESAETKKAENKFTIIEGEVSSQTTYNTPDGPITVKTSQKEAKTVDEAVENMKEYADMFIKEEDIQKVADMNPQELKEKAQEILEAAPDIKSPDALEKASKLATALEQLSHAKEKQANSEAMEAAKELGLGKIDLQEAVKDKQKINDYLAEESGMNVLGKAEVLNQIEANKVSQGAFENDEKYQASKKQVISDIIKNIEKRAQAEGDKSRIISKMNQKKLIEEACKKYPALAEDIREKARSVATD